MSEVIKVFRPVSPEEREKSFTKAKMGKLDTLDMQFGGFCNARCYYCDTPKYRHPNALDMDTVEKRRSRQVKLTGLISADWGNPLHPVITYANLYCYVTWQQNTM